MIMSLDGFYDCQDNNCLKLCVATESGIIDIFDVKSQKILKSHKIKFNEKNESNSTALTCLKLNDTKTNGILSCSGNELIAFKMNIFAQKNKEWFKIVQSVEMPNDGASSVCIRRSDYKIFCVGGWDNRCRVYSWKKLKLLSILGKNGKMTQSNKMKLDMKDSDLVSNKIGITDVSFHPFENILATGTKNGNIQLFRLY